MADIYTEEETNFFRLLKAFLNSVNASLRICFKEQWNISTGKEWTNDAESGKSFVELEQLGKKKSKLFSPDYANSLDFISTGDVSTWDSTTLFFALLYSKAINLTDPSKGYRKFAVCRMAPLTLGEHIDHLRKIRNNCLFHINQAQIENHKFLQHMNNIITAVTAIIGKDHEIVADIVKLKHQSEDIFQMLLGNSLKQMLEREKQSAVEFHQNLEELEHQIRQSLYVFETKVEGRSPFEDKELKNTFEDEVLKKLPERHNMTADQTVLILTVKGQMQRNSQKLKEVGNCVVEIMYPNRPELKKAYRLLINTSNNYSYQFDWENFHEFISQTLFENTEDFDMILFAKVQLAKGLSHQGRKKEALQLLNELTSSAYKARNSAVVLARIFYRKAYILYDLKDVENASQNILLAEQILVTSESFEDRAEIQYAKANISLATCLNEEHGAVVSCLNNTIEASGKAVVDMSVLERQALLRNSLVHLGFMQHFLKADIASGDVRTASELLDRFLKCSCHEELSKRNQLFLLMCQSLLAHYQNHNNLAAKFAEKAHGITLKHGLHHEVKQVEMVKSHIIKPH